MADPTTSSRLTRLVLSAVELRQMTDWPSALIEDYLNILDDLITLANEIDDLGGDKMSLVPGATTGNLPEFDADGQVVDSGESVGTIRARSYFYGRAY